ncbi:MAG: hypothetical protein AB8G77_28160 [Rhodothermales bacterium]
MMPIAFQSARKVLCGWFVLALFSVLSFCSSAQFTSDESIAVTSFTLIDAREDVAIPGYDPIPDGAIINLRELQKTN